MVFVEVHLDLFADIKIAETGEPRDREMVGVARGDVVPVIELIGVHV